MQMRLRKHLILKLYNMIKRPAPFGIRLNPNTKLLLEKKAKLKGLKLHAYCKDVLTKHADRK
jgi:hypothetical protein